MSSKIKNINIKKMKVKELIKNYVELGNVLFTKYEKRNNLIPLPNEVKEFFNSDVLEEIEDLTEWCTLNKINYSETATALIKQYLKEFDKVNILLDIDDFYSVYDAIINKSDIEIYSFKIPYNEILNCEDINQFTKDFSTWEKVNQQYKNVICLEYEKKD